MSFWRKTVNSHDRYDPEGVISMLGRGRPLIGSLCVLSVLAVSAGAGAVNPSYQVPVGPRALAMGGAFTSIANDASAIFWNPAGLSRIGNQEIAATHADLFGLGIKDNFAAFVLPLSPRQAIGVDWYHSGFDDDELGFGENRFDLSYGIRLNRWFSLGSTVKYLTRNTDLDGVEVTSGSGTGLDLGLLLTPWKGLRFGWVGQDLFDTEVDFDGTSSVAFPQNSRFATAYAFGSRGVVAMDIDDRIHLGGELRLVDALALRAGMEQDRSGPEDWQFTYGAGFELGVFHFDYAFVDHPVLEATHHVGLSLAFNFNPSRVRIEQVKPREVYASLYKSYVDEPIGSVVVRNLEDEALPTRIRTFVPGLMDTPTEQEILLRPQAVQEVPITAVFSERIMRQSGDRPVQVQVEVSYQSQRLPRAEKRSGKGVAYGPGAIDWSRGLEQAAAFVTPRDPAVDGLARQAVHSLSPNAEAKLPSRNIRYAAAMFNAVRAMDIAYVPDPHNPYSAISETPRAVDTIHYPRETLETRSGDCDDTSVLMASLLANVGVRTQFVDVPGHLFLLVDTGIHERNRLMLGLDEDMYVVSGDGIWVPLETTALGQGFSEAWRRGAEEYRGWESRGRLALVDVSAAQSRYAPAEFVDPMDVASLDQGRVGNLVSRDVETISTWRDEFMTARYGAVQRDLASSPEALSEIAHVYFLGGHPGEARETLERILREDPESALAHNNLAVLSAAAGDMETAVEHLRAALDGASQDAGVWLNLGVVRYAGGDRAGAERAIAEGLGRAGDFEDACRLLGLEVSDSGSRAAVERLSAEELRLLLEAVLEKLPAAEVVVDPNRPGGVDLDAVGEPEHVKVPPEPIRLRIAASRAADQMEIANHLYWKVQ